ncbi:MAG: orotidine-5'-phosphate decarboxylase [Halothiobacillaceae bacterium]|jgi:orotidine-5'-phosphate decarboxylase
MAFLDPRIVVALDYAHPAEAIALAHQLDPRSCRLKVGKELFTLAGPAVVEQLHQLSFEVFLDLKFHDIPNTVAQAVKAAASLGVWMVNVHALGGRRMMEAAREALEGGQHRPHLIAVTVLTSMDEEDLHEIGLLGSPVHHVEHLAGLARQCGLDGVVCSAREANELRRMWGPRGLLVTPGVRPRGSDVGDQRRVVTPGEAIALGASHLVVGRPITRAEDPQAALEAIRAEIGELS